MNTAKKITIWSVAAISALLLFGVGIAFSYLWDLRSNFEQVEVIEDSFPDETLRPAKATPKADEKNVPINILLLGSDTRGETGEDVDAIRGERSDTIMLMHIPADRKDVQVISIMRDYWVGIPGHGSAKINAAMSYGGVPLLVQTLEDLLGVRVDHVAVIDFKGFEGLTDALGGVTVNNSIEFTDRGSYFPAGEITLSGEPALKYVRARYPFVDGDYQRVRNQQEFMRGVLRKTLSKETLTDPQTISRSVAEIVPFLKLDKEFTSDFMLDLGLSMRGITRDSFRFFTVPTGGIGWEGDQSVVYVDTQRLLDLANHLQNDTVDEYTPTPDW